MKREPAFLKALRATAVCWKCGNFKVCVGAHGLTGEQLTAQLKDCHQNGSVML